MTDIRGWDMTVVGTVAVDDITTPEEHHPNLYGGSAIYAALAAAKSAVIHLHGPVGHDEASAFRALFADLPVTFDGFREHPLPTLRWHARHDFRLGIATELAVERGCSEHWEPRLTPAGRASPVLLVACMAPERQLRVLDQANARLVGIDSRQDMIESHRGLVDEGIRQADILFLNRTELQALVPRYGTDWLASARSLLGTGRLRAVVVKGGPAGAACVSDAGVVQQEAYRVDHVADPTGAGDALAGGFLGTCARLERDGPDVYRKALDVGLRCAAGAIASFGVEALVQFAHGTASAALPRFRRLVATDELPVRLTTGGGHRPVAAR